MEITKTNWDNGLCTTEQKPTEQIDLQPTSTANTTQPCPTSFTNKFWARALLLTPGNFQCPGVSVAVQRVTKVVSITGLHATKKAQSPVVDNVEVGDVQISDMNICGHPCPNLSAHLGCHSKGQPLLPKLPWHNHENISVGTPGHLPNLQQ